MSTARFVLAWFLLAPGLACDRESKPIVGPAPAPLNTVRQNVCGEGKPPARDPEIQALNLGKLGGYCEDPNAEFKAYGEGAEAALEDACLQLFNGECELYKQYGLVRVNTGRYIHSDGSPGAVNVYVSRFATQDGAFGFYTKRVVAGADPLLLRMKPLSAGVSAALGAGIAHVFTGGSVAELSYSNELETPEQMTARANQLLPILARSLGEKLRGTGAIPRAVQLLPVEQRLEFGMELHHQDVLGQPGAGSGALGYYQHGTQRYRVMVAHRTDEESAKDTLRTLRRSSGRRDLEDMPYDAFELTIPSATGGPATVWLVAQHNNVVVAAGDEAFALKRAMTDAEKAPLCLGRAAKFALIKAVFQANTSR